MWGVWKGGLFIVYVCIWFEALNRRCRITKTKRTSHGSYNHLTLDPERHLFLSQTHPPPHQCSSQPTTSLKALRCLCGFLVRLRFLCVSQGLTVVTSMTQAETLGWVGWELWSSNWVDMGGEQYRQRRGDKVYAEGIVRGEVVVVVELGVDRLLVWDWASAVVRLTSR
jgi:hypothetical protein